MDCIGSDTTEWMTFVFLSEDSGKAHVLRLMVVPHGSLSLQSRPLFLFFMLLICRAKSHFLDWSLLPYSAI